MITVQQLKQYLIQKLVDIPALKSQELIVDDSELSKFLKELKKEQSPMLLGVMPAYTVQGDDDSNQWGNKLMFFILHKTAYRDLNHQEYINVFIETQSICRRFVELMLEEKANYQGLFCNNMAFLDENSINVYPVWKKQECNGWAIEVDVLTTA